MLLWLIRHGECELTAASDAERRLTAEGRADVAKVAARVQAARRPAPELVFTSPLQRARQSAEIFNAYWGRELRIAEFLQPHVEPSKVLLALRPQGNRDVALFGHMPNLGLLLATLIWGLPPREAVVPRGAAALLDLSEWEPGKARLLEFFKPEEIP